MDPMKLKKEIPAMIILSLEETSAALIDSNLYTVRYYQKTKSKSKSTYKPKETGQTEEEQM